MKDFYEYSKEKQRNIDYYIYQLIRSMMPLEPNSPLSRAQLDWIDGHMDEIRDMVSRYMQTNMQFDTCIPQFTDENGQTPCYMNGGCGSMDCPYSVREAC